MSRNPLGALPGHLGNSLGDYLREQRVTKKLSVRQLSALAGVSNPYLSQIERGVKRPSAEILQQIAKGLSISAETLYVQAGLLDPQEATSVAGDATRTAISVDPALTSRQRQTLLDIYESFVAGGPSASPADAQAKAAPKAAAQATPKKAAPKKATQKKATPKKTATKAAATKTTASTKTSAASKKGSSSASSKNTSASRAARGTTTSSSTSTPRRSA